SSITTVKPAPAHPVPTGQPASIWPAWPALLTVADQHVHILVLRLLQEIGRYDKNSCAGRADACVTAHCGRLSVFCARRTEAVRLVRRHGWPGADGRAGVTVRRGRRPGDDRRRADRHWPVYAA